MHLEIIKWKYSMLLSFLMLCLVDMLYRWMKRNLYSTQMCVSYTCKGAVQLETLVYLRECVIVWKCVRA